MESMETDSAAGSRATDNPNKEPQHSITALTTQTPLSQNERDTVQLIPKGSVKIDFDTSRSDHVSNHIDQHAQPPANGQITQSMTPPSGHQLSKSTEPQLKKSSGKYTTQYVLPDGTVAVNGKGLGKGRPGIKRGPRQPKSADDNAAQISPSPSTPLVSNIMKRKRTDSSASMIPPLSRTSSQSRESTPEYNPASSQTRSGRQVQRPVSIVPSTSTPISPAPKRVNSNSTTSTPNLKSHPKIRRRVYKGKEQFALCEHCLRSFGPPTNVIVFCDACNKCWHQRCHEPPISKEVVTDTKAEWFCATCDKILHPGKQKAKKATTPVKPELMIATPEPPPVQLYGLPMVGGAALTEDQRKTYLNALSKDKLISIILNASALSPQLPMFQRPLPSPLPPPQQPLPQFASNYTTPVDTTMFDFDSGKSGNLEVQDEGYDDRSDEYAALYPKAGEGVQLPPDRTDLHMLLEGPDSKTFSHWVRGMNMKIQLDSLTLVQG